MINETFISNTLASFIAGITSGVILMYLTKLFSQNKHTTGTNYSMKQVKSIQIELDQSKRTSIHHHHPSKKSNHTDDGGSMLILIIAGCLFLTYLFVRYMDEIIITYQYLLATIVTFLILTLIHQYKLKVINGSDWILFMVFSALISMFNFYLLQLVRDPYIQEYSVSQNMLLASADTFSSFILDGGYKATWLMYQMFGMVLLLISVVVLLPVLIYYNVSIRLIQHRNNSMFLWFNKITRNFSKPIHILFISATLNLLSFLLISGLAHHWLTD
ncbi:hypothetical protein N7E81_07195 [Reichenbachiella carrageenanivorans]|uniref:Uncharacterized protein n=1 Tax=Reichenbachiella carrageenanivorans TaxID=2979869 RepID=A0ABY6D509_9BACT|nr:hypothetical protein [Reichenbachiella carrageenanivorans]UXX80884.1 hypothetical protein N7E81_07195 [Reichenbachiella carrageenanivorans]